MDLDASLPPWEKIFIRRGVDISWFEIGSYVWCEGDLTLTFDNDNICWKKVKGKIKHNWSSELITFTTETGKEVCVTNNHSIFAAKKNSIDKAPYLIDAKDLKVDDFVVTYGSNLNSKKISLERITKTLRQTYTGSVYDISVEDTERFFAGTGIGVHNSSLYPSNGGF